MIKDNMNTKQVIIIRKDLKMRRGKECAQASHASMAFLTKESGVYASSGEWEFRQTLQPNHEDEVWHWLKNSFRKICVYVNSEEELDELHKKALDSGLISHIIEDNGATEFNGVKTKTAVAIGPHYDDKFIGITDHLPLL